MNRLYFALIVAVAACGKDVTAPTLAVGTYSVFMVDARQIPIVTRQDSSCETINSGGWLSLDGRGGYSMALDRVTTVCNGIASGAALVAQIGTYEQMGDSLLVFHPAPPRGPAFMAAYDPGTFQLGLGGRLPSLRFDFVGHNYWLIEDALP